MTEIVGDERLRRGLAHLAPDRSKRCGRAERSARATQLAKSTAWTDTALSGGIRDALPTAWILDIATAIKLLYGHQAGAEVGYDPRERRNLSARPADRIEAMIANIRAGLDHVLATAPRLPTIGRWRAPVRYIVSQILATRPQNPAPVSLSAPRLALGSG